ncbi:hypothetical protein [Terrarubrum flagellatum]|uniref:hypothetical protein n=1 Tax=Terrirubrum flagellatum TaxID=2895980 RepID=UPI003144DA46
MSNQYWFRPKSYGYGATPSSWEGWALVAIFAALVAFSGFAILGKGGGASAANWLWWGLTVVILVAVLTAIAYWKTDGDWRWRP